MVTLGILIAALSWWDMTPQEVREGINQRIFSIVAPTPIVGSVVDHTVLCESGDTPIRIYIPKGQLLSPLGYTSSAEGSFPVILLIHGGAWVGGNLDTHDHLARYLCNKTRAVVISVGYLNAPEGKFPRALEQCYAVWRWSLDQASEYLYPGFLGIADASKLAVVGDSAGGNMAAALCLMIRDRNGPNPVLQVLINPVLDLTCEGSLERQGDALDPLRWQAVQYLSFSDEASHPYVSPLVAKDLTNLPKTLVILASDDFLYQGGYHYANRLFSAGVPVEVYCQQGIGHLAGDGARASFRALESLNAAVGALQETFRDGCL